MVPMKSGGVPIRPYDMALTAGAKRSFGTNPYMKAYDPGRTYNMTSFQGLGMNRNGSAGCGCSATTGCGCGGVYSMSGLGQSASLDQVISNATSWLTGVAESTLPASAAVPPAVGSVGNIVNSLYTYLPYLLIGYVGYRLLR